MNGLAKTLLGHIDTLTGTVERECALAWVYLSALAVWAEDHGLVAPRLRAKALPDRAKAFKAKTTAVGWLRGAIAALTAHPGTACLTDPRYTRYRDAEPTEEQALELLDWWAYQAPGLGGIDGFLIGNLRQALLDEATQKRDGVVYTPVEVVDFQVKSVIASTRKAHPGQGVRVLDPMCGTGHYLVRYAQILWGDYTTQGLSPQSVFETLTATVCGCEIDPLSAAVARLRLVAVLADLACTSGLIASRRLDAIPRFVPQIAVGDTFLAGISTSDEYALQRPDLAAIQNLGVPSIEWEAPWMARSYADLHMPPIPEETRT